MVSGTGARCNWTTWLLRKSKSLGSARSTSSTSACSSPARPDRQAAEHRQDHQDEREERQQRVVGNGRREGEILAVVELDDAAAGGAPCQRQAALGLTPRLLDDRGAIGRQIASILPDARIIDPDAMDVLASHLKTDTPEFAANRARMTALVAELRERHARVQEGGGPRYLERHRQQGKLPVRERIASCSMPTRRSSSCRRWRPGTSTTTKRRRPGVVTGIGRVSGREVMIVANDATVKGGSYLPMTVKKHVRAQQIALDNRLPCVYLVDSGGAFLPLQDEVFPDREHFGRIFYNQARMSAERIPQVAVVMGSCTAGGAYVPAMSDEDDHRQGHGHHLPRRPAAREGGDRRGSHRRRTGRRRRAHAPLGRRGLLRRRRRARAAAGAHDRLHAPHDQAAARAT